MVTTANRSIDRNLVLHLPLTEGTGSKVWDRSQYGNHGDFGAGAAAPSWADGRSGLKCLSFDGGGDYMLVSADPSIDVFGKTELTYSAWINPASDGESGDGRILDKRGPSTGPQWWVSSESDGFMSVRILMDFIVQDAEAHTDRILSINNWHLVTVVYNEDGDNRFKIYLDGLLALLLVDNEGQGAIVDDSAVDLYVSNRQAFGRTFDGLIGEIRIYNRALSAQEVRTLFSQRGRI